jgi:uncharacterized protein YndB with AHSA1/START domain
MTVISTDKNPEALSLTLVAEFDAGMERVWKLFEDPRQLERWWGPPTYPATFYRHEFVPGGKASYYMTSPEGEKSHGWWEFTSMDAPRRLEFNDGFADSDGNPTGERTRMTMLSTFESEEQLEQMLQMGMEEGLKEAVGQIDGILAEHANA